FRFGFLHVHRPSTQIAAVQSGNRLVGFCGVDHLDEPETAGPSRITIGHNADSFYRAVFLENGSQFRLGCAVGKVAHVKVLHCISSLYSSTSISDCAAMRLGSVPAESRGGKGLSRNALVRASARDRTAEIRRHASRIPQYFDPPRELR